jgi:MATE family multidrug resistance protein
LTGARGFWFANMASLAIAGSGLLVYLRSVSRRYLQADFQAQMDKVA